MDIATDVTYKSIYFGFSIQILRNLFPIKLGKISW